MNHPTKPVDFLVESNESEPDKMGRKMRTSAGQKERQENKTLAYAEHKLRKTELPHHPK